MRLGSDTGSGQETSSLEQVLRRASAGSALCRQLRAAGPSGSRPSRAHGPPYPRRAVARLDGRPGWTARPRSARGLAHGHGCQGAQGVAAHGTARSYAHGLVLKHAGLEKPWRHLVCKTKPLWAARPAPSAPPGAAPSLPLARPSQEGRGLPDRRRKQTWQERHGHHTRWRHTGHGVPKRRGRHTRRLSLSAFLLPLGL